MICITLKHDLYHVLNAKNMVFLKEFAAKCRQNSMKFIDVEYVLSIGVTAG